MASYRHLARIAVMQTLFSYEFRNGKIAPDLESNCEEFADKLTDLTFARQLLNGILEHQAAIRVIISKEAPEWPIDRIAPIDLVVLEMGTFEIMFSKDVPPVVAINEAIEIAKVFGDLNSSKFINGVLSTIMNKYKQPADQKTFPDPVKPVLKPSIKKPKTKLSSTKAKLKPSKS